MHCVVATVCYIITVTIKVPSFDDVNTFSQVILSEQTLTSYFLTN